ncbi:MAG: aspartate dehydrogenase [Candidatus Anstonellaceae archaeon]
MKIGLIGFGNIGSFLASKLGKRINWVVDCDDGALKRMRKLGLTCPFYKEIPRGCEGVQLVVEAASQEAVPLLEECLEYCDVMIMSVGALTDDLLKERLYRKAKQHGRKIYIPSGAIGGLDAISSLRGKIKSVLLETYKPPSSLGRKDAERKIVFEGSAREACALYPKNINVAATLSLAGIGMQKTKVRIISDPAAKNIVHKIFVKSVAGKIEMIFDNLPSKHNPKTSMLAALSALDTIKKIEEEILIG